jgi:serine/threonine-protein kinase RIM15
VFGIPPFHAGTPVEIFANVVQCNYSFPEPDDDDTPVSPELIDLITKLLNPDPGKRLGAGGIREIKEHSWFTGIDWEHVDRLKSPFIPDVGPESTRYFQERGGSEDLPIEDDILADMMADREEKAAEPRPNGGIPLTPIARRQRPAPASVNEPQLAKFPGVSFRRLGVVNQEIAMQYKRRASVMMVPRERGDSLPEKLQVVPQSSPGVPRSSSMAFKDAC